MFKGIIKYGSEFGTKLYYNMRKYSPEILTGLGIGGFISSIVLAVKATPQAEEALEIAQEEANEKGEELSTGDKIKATYKYYIPTALSAAASTVCVVSSVCTSRKRYGGMVVAYELLEQSARRYRESVEEVVAQKDIDKIEHKEAEKTLAASNPSTVVINNILDKGPMSRTIPGTSLFYEPRTNMYFYADVTDFKGEAMDAREAATDGPDGYLSFMDWLRRIGIDDFIPLAARIEYENLGWNPSTQSGAPKITTKAVKSERFNGIPVLCIQYSIMPIPDYEWYNK